MLDGIQHQFHGTQQVDLFKLLKFVFITWYWSMKIDGFQEYQNDSKKRHEFLWRVSISTKLAPYRLQNDKCLRSLRIREVFCRHRYKIGLWNWLSVSMSFWGFQVLWIIGHKWRCMIQVDGQPNFLPTLYPTFLKLNKKSSL